MNQLLMLACQGTPVNGRPLSGMRTISPLVVLSVLLLAGFQPATLRGAEDGIALAIIYDTSGSMKEAVPDASGGSAPKYVIANRALLEVTRQLQAFATNTTTGTPRKIQAGLFVFQVEHAREVVPLGPLDAGAFERWANRFSSPHGNTPLGNALTTA